MSSASPVSTGNQEPKPFSHYFAVKTDDDYDPLRAPLKMMRCAGLTLEMRTGTGTFARAGLDAGSQLLIETFLQRVSLPTTARVCDLGCGWGAVGCFVATKYPDASVSLVDINSRAVKIAQTNLSGNELFNAHVWCGDGLSAARSKYFDAILCNPPVRAGNRVIEGMFLEAQRCLIDDGALWVVLRTQQGAKSWQKRLAQQFGNCETLLVENGYRILKSVNPKAKR